MSSKSVFSPRGAISTALDAIRADGGPDLDMPTLAAETRVSLQWIRQLDEGQLSPIGLQQLERLCRVLGRSPNDLLGYEADE
jgi:DNA-binding Xre family transcriptional regulator